ncbi:multidrug transporter subunit MdtN [Achromobacter sp. JUb104]|jgi:multidrug efflux system membrane fusion protein|uniref:multidrug transporter subunit MdtN n=1 Tax=unclassified Achromobacter TaxID=2626865 RepID=UPI002166CE55|nr:multidrug transporter subunit MdtN [Achromobacter sp. JUb104]MCS3509256.1 multidrug efflux system membrane fusion protein [Achromobacter sp. JUb104]
MPPTQSVLKQRRIAVALAVLIVGLAVVAGLAYVGRIGAKPLSEDAVLTTDVARVAAAVPGRVVVLNVRENSQVSRGQVLFSIDPEFYRLQVEQAAAGLQMAEAALSSRDRSVVAEHSNASIAAEQVARAQANAQLSAQTWERLNALLPKGYVTRQQVDEAATLKRNAQTSLKEAQAQLAAAQALIGNAKGAQALVAERRAALAIAERQLRETEVKAPFDGRVAGLSITVGDYMIPAQSAFSLIDTTRWFATATFLETELPSIKPGDCATVYAAADRRQALKGVVESTGWGVSDEDLINLPRRLPYVPKSLNWVRVGQRFPVRVKLDDPPAELMRVGASAVVMVEHEKRC